VAETPLGKLARLLGGVALTQGRLGHQVLGQLLISNTTAVELAGANVAIAATARRRNVFTQAAVGTAAPALAVHGIARREAKRLERISQASADALRQEEAKLQSGWAELRRRRKEDAPPQDSRICEMEREIQQLRADVAELRRRLDERATDVGEPEPPPLRAVTREIEPVEPESEIDPEPEPTPDPILYISARPADPVPAPNPAPAPAEPEIDDHPLPSSPAISKRAAKNSSKPRGKGSKRK
jgi:hypothetical protein